MGHPAETIKVLPLHLIAPVIKKSKRMSEGGTRTRILSEGGSRSRTCSESSDLGDATGPVKTTRISYDLDGKFSFTKIMKPGQLSQSLTGVGGSGKTFSYVTSDMRPVPPGWYDTDESKYKVPIGWYDQCKGKQTGYLLLAYKKSKMQRAFF